MLEKGDPQKSSRKGSLKSAILEKIFILRAQKIARKMGPTKICWEACSAKNLFPKGAY